MPFTAGPWELASVFSKVLSYASLASLAGGFLILWLGSVTTARISAASSSPESPALANISTTRRLSWLLSTRQHLCKMLLLACVIGSLAVVVFFLLQVGVVNQNGIAGMFDGFMAVASSWPVSVWLELPCCWHGRHCWLPQRRRCGRPC